MKRREGTYNNSEKRVLQAQGRRNGNEHERGKSALGRKQTSEEILGKFKSQPVNIT